MKRIVFCALLLLWACAPPQQRAECVVTASHELDFSGAGGAEIVEARAFGASCDKAIALLTVRDQEGRPVWAWTAPLARAFGDQFALADAEQVQAFVNQWTQATTFSSAQAPAWEAQAAGQTSLDQHTYEDIRTRALPVLCHLSGVARETCVFWEPAAGAAGHFYDRGVAIEDGVLEAR